MNRMVCVLVAVVAIGMIVGIEGPVFHWYDRCLKAGRHPKEPPGFHQYLRFDLPCYLFVVLLGVWTRPGLPAWCAAAAVSAGLTACKWTRCHWLFFRDGPGWGYVSLVAYGVLVFFWHLLLLRIGWVIGNRCRHRSS